MALVTVRLPVTATAPVGMFRAGSLDRLVTPNMTGTLWESLAGTPMALRESTIRLGVTGM